MTNTFQLTNAVQNRLKSVPLGDWMLSDMLGQRLDTMAKARMTTPSSWQKIYPETEEAFRLREDDQSHPGRGVWRGEFWGKYILSSIAAFRYYRDEQLGIRIAEAVRGLLSTQDDNGYIGTYTDSSYMGPNTWNIWGRKYTLWALLEAWELFGEDEVLAAAVKFADHLIGEAGPAGKPIIQTGQFCGIPSTSILKPIVKLYQATDQRRFLDFAEYIVDQWSSHPQGIPDIVNKGLTAEPIQNWFPEPDSWAKSYEFVSCVEGLLELYRATGKDDYLKATQNIYQVIVDWERNPVGSISFNDKFIGSRFLINTVSEICDAVYWNRLSFELFLLTGEVRYIEEIELTLYNTLLCGMKLDGTWALRRLRLTHEHIPASNHFLEHHQCCVDNLPRGLLQAAESAVFTDAEGVYITLYNAGKGHVDLPSGQSAKLEVSGDFLNDGQVRIVLSPDRPERANLCLRIPTWSRSTEVHVNGEVVPAVLSGAWLTLEREWSGGDVVTVRLDVGIRAEYFDPSKFDMDDPIITSHKKTWARMGFAFEDNVTLKMVQKTNLTVKDALPHQRAVMLFRGPLALARDIRLGDDHVFLPIPSGTDLDRVSEVSVGEHIPGIWKTYNVKLSTGQTIRLCDFASAGNTWDEKSVFAAWMLCE